MVKELRQLSSEIGIDVSLITVEKARAIPKTADPEIGKATAYKVPSVFNHPTEFPVGPELFLHRT